MMKLNSIKYNPLLLDVGLLLFRIFLGFAMLSHGFPKLQKLLGGGDIEFMNFLGFGPSFSLGLAVFAEFVCSIFLILGLFTRPVLIPLIIVMFVAFFGVHISDEFGKMETALLYLFGYILLFFAGPGRFSIDGMISNRRESRW